MASASTARCRGSSCNGAILDRAISHRKASGAEATRRRAARRSASAEMSKKHPHTAGAVGIAHLGNPAAADSQIYVTLADRPDLNGKYVVFGRIISGGDVPAQLQKGDLIRKMYVRE